MKKSIGKADRPLSPLDLDTENLSRLDFLLLLDGIARLTGVELVRRTFYLPGDVKHETVAVRKKPVSSRKLD